MYPLTYWCTETTGGQVHHIGYWLGCAWHENYSYTLYTQSVPN